MMTRRDCMQVALAAAALTAGSGPLGRLAAQQAITEDQLLAFEPKGQVTLLHLTDLHAQLKPLYFREPSINLGVGPVAGLPPHLTGNELLTHFGIKPGSIGSRRWSKQSVPSVRTTPCCWTAAIAGRGLGPRCRPGAKTWSKRWRS